MESTDIVAQAEQIAETAEGTLYDYAKTYRTDRAVGLWQLGYRRSDLGGWIARLDGHDATYGYKRAFLPKSWPLRYERKATPAFDFDGIVAGDFIEVSGADSHRHSDEREIYRVVAIDDTGVRLIAATTTEIKRFLKQADRA